MDILAFVFGIKEALVVIFFIAWVWALVEVWNNKALDKNAKIIWVISLVVFNVVSTTVYWVLRIWKDRKS